MIDIEPRDQSGRLLEVRLGGECLGLENAPTSLGQIRDVGTQFSYPTIRRMFGHLYAADKVWLARWRGGTLTADPGGQFTTLASIRAPWDDLEREQRAFVEGASAADLAQVIHFNDAQGVRRGAPLGPLLQHVVNHATHHRSEIATMLTMVSSSPPDTGLGTYLRDAKNP